jgi:hypothetical protein
VLPPSQLRRSGRATKQSNGLSRHQVTGRSAVHCAPSLALPSPQQGRGYQTNAAPCLAPHPNNHWIHCSSRVEYVYALLQQSQAGIFMQRCALQRRCCGSHRSLSLASEWGDERSPELHQHDRRGLHRPRPSPQPDAPRAHGEPAGPRRQGRHESAHSSRPRRSRGTHSLPRQAAGDRGRSRVHQPTGRARAPGGRAVVRG